MQEYVVQIVIPDGPMQPFGKNHASPLALFYSIYFLCANTFYLRSGLLFIIHAKGAQEPGQPNQSSSRILETQEEVLVHGKPETLIHTSPHFIPY